MNNNFDVIVIGSGPGGYVCAIRCAQLGLKTACVESRQTLGGTCLNVGCIPSKSLLNASEMYHKTQNEFGNMGIEVNAKLNLSKMMNNKNKSVSILTKGVEFLYKKNKITHLRGTGSIPKKNTIVVHKPYYAHAFKATTKVILLAFADGKRGGKDYEKDTFRLKTKLI